MTWERSTFRDLGEWFGGGTPSKANAEYWLEGEIPWLSPKDMGPMVLADTQDHITPAAVAGSSVREVPADSVAVVVRSGILERTLPVALVPFTTTLNQDMKAVVPRRGVDPRWIAWGLRAYERDLLRDTRKAGTTVASIEMPRFYRSTLPVPELAEQRRIIGILEDHLSRLDAAAENAGLALARVSATLRIQSEYFAKVAGGMPTTLEAVSTLITDGDHNPPKRVGSGVPHVTAKGITPDGRIDLSLGTYVTPEGFAQTSKRYRPQQDDVIVTCVGTIGRVAVVPPGIEFSADRNLAAVRPDPGIVHAEYVRMWLDGPTCQHRMATASGSTAQPHLYLRDLRAIAIHRPSLSDQDRVVRQSAEIRDSLIRVSNALTHASSRSAALRRAVLTAAFEGTLTGRHTDDDVIAATAAGER